MHLVDMKVAVLALFLLLKNFVRAIRLRRQEIDLELGSIGHTSPQAKLLKHRKNKERTARTIQGTLERPPARPHAHRITWHDTCHVMHTRHNTHAPHAMCGNDVYMA